MRLSICSRARAGYDADRKAMICTITDRPDSRSCRVKVSPTRKSTSRGLKNNSARSLSIRRIWTFKGTRSVVTIIIQSVQGVQFVSHDIAPRRALNRRRLSLVTNQAQGLPLARPNYESRAAFRVDPLYRALEASL